MPDRPTDFATLAIEQMQNPQACLRIALEDPCGDPRRALEAMIAAIDRKLSNQIRPILHHPDFQQLEGAWRGLHHLVARTETDETLKIKFIDLSKAELRETLEAHQGSRSRNPLFVQIHDETYRRPGGEPFGCLVGDYYFDHRPRDVAMLRELADICEFIHAPFLAGGAPSIIGAKSWREGLGRVEDCSKSRFSTGEFDPWLSLRDTENSNFLYLAIPRFLARPLYGAATHPVTEFDFQEEDGYDFSVDHNFTWINAAYVIAAIIVRAFEEHGWCTSICDPESLGLIKDLPTHIFPTADDGIHARGCTEIAIDQQIGIWAAKTFGFIALLLNQNSGECFFIITDSLRQPRDYDDPDAKAHYILSGRLNHLLAACRFAHYLRCIVRDNIVAYRNRLDMQNQLQMWLQQYVCENIHSASDENWAKKPLAAAEIWINEIKGISEYYMAKLFIRPHYQVLFLSASMRMIFYLPVVEPTKSFRYLRN